jgi:tape measure domain-containing protein
MSTEQTLKWSLQFDVAGGAALKQATSLLQDLSTKISEASSKTNKASGVMKNAFSGGSSGGGSGILGAVGNLKNALSGVEAGGLSAVGSLGRMAGMAGPVGVVAAAVVGLGVGIKKAYDGIDEITERAIEGFSMRTSIMRSYSTILGSAQQAQERFNKVSELGLRTEFTREQLQGIDTRLTVAGFRGKEADNMLLTISDLAAVLPENERKMGVNRAGLAFSQIKQKGYLQGEEIRQLAGFLNVGMLKEEIAKSVGKNPGDVDQLVRDKKISADVALAAAQRATLKQLGTSKLGEFSTGAAGSISTMLSNREEALQNAFLNIDPESLPGFKRYKDAIEGVTQAMNASTESGKNVKFALEDLSNIGMSFRAAGNSFVSGFIESFAESYRKAVSAFGGDSKSVASSFEMLTEAMKKVGTIVGYVGYAAGFLSRVFEKAGNVADFVSNVMSVAWGFVKDYAAYAAGPLKMVGTLLGVLGKVGEKLWWVLEKLGSAFITIYEVIASFLARVFHGVGSIIEGIVSRSWSKIKEGASFLWNGTSLSGEKTSFQQALDNLRTNQENRDQKLANEAAESIQQKALQENIEKKKLEAMKTSEASSSGGGGGGGRGSREKGGIPISFDYAGSLPVITSAQLSPVVGPVPPTMASPQAPSPVRVDTIIINVDGGSSSPTEIANQIYTKISQQLARLGASPNVRVM